LWICMPLGNGGADTVEDGDMEFNDVNVGSIPMELTHAIEARLCKLTSRPRRVCPLP
jgi:hypothetical protein